LAGRAEAQAYVHQQATIGWIGGIAGEQKAGEGDNALSGVRFQEPILAISRLAPQH
jgi:hypothetical protein